jgi:hypothetical protein
MTSLLYTVLVMNTPSVNTTGACSFRSRFARPVFLWAVTGVATQIIVDWIFKHPGHYPVPRWLGLAPILPMMFFVVALVRAVQKMDELQRRIFFESVAIAFVATLALTLVFAGLDIAGIYRASYDDLGTPMMAIWAGAYIFCSWRYR